MGLLRPIAAEAGGKVHLAEHTVLAVIAAEIAGKGECTLTLEHIAALAGVCRTSVKNALREAQGLGFIRVEERRLSA